MIALSLLPIALYVSMRQHSICWVYYIKVFFESSIRMVLFLLHELSQYTINIASFNKLVHVLWVLISYFKD